jgi:chemotaxis protein MotB
MARKKKVEAPANTDGWLTTYADLVSLLLCFFVLMYTASTPDEARMQWILRSMTDLSGTIINPVHVEEEPMENSANGEEDNRGPDHPTNDPEAETLGMPGSMPLTFDDLFNWVSEIVAQDGENSGISVSMENGRLHIRFDSDIMFEPDSYTITPQGRVALGRVVTGIRAVNPYIATVEVQGHTSPVAAGGFGGIDDWDLSGRRASVVTSFLDHWHRMVDSDKFSAHGFAQFKPHYSTADPIENAKNRRVELVITRNEVDPELTSTIVDILDYDYRLKPIPGAPIDGRKPDPADLNRIRQIEQRIFEKYGDLDEKDDTGEPINEFGPAIPKLPNVSDFVVPEEGEGGNGEAVPSATPVEPVE